jgi:acyl-CoA reductase-like NAD-dependent aldehyde dehydrogenase
VGARRIRESAGPSDVAITGIRSGSFGINQAYSMDPVAPFGGIKTSGIGREFGREGLAGYLTTKSVSGVG